MSDAADSSRSSDGKFSSVSRRRFLKGSAIAAVTSSAVSGRSMQSLARAAPQKSAAPEQDPSGSSYRFDGPDSEFHGHGWESLNPGYWHIRDGALRRRLVNVGDRARSTGFPFHAMTHGGTFRTEYDPSLPSGILYRNDWKLSGGYSITGMFTYKGGRPPIPAGDAPEWKMHSPGNGWLGIAIGARSLFESYTRIRHAIQIVWSDDGSLRLVAPKSRRKNQQVVKLPDARVKAPALKAGDTVKLAVHVRPTSNGKASITAELTVGASTVRLETEADKRLTEGYTGLVARGLIDFQVDEFAVNAQPTQKLSTESQDCLTCYPLGDTLRKVNGKWQLRFVGMFASDGRKIELRISDIEQPAGGWRSVPVAGQAPLVSHQWRRNTAVVTATLPADPSTTELYYTVWKDGVDVTGDVRIGAANSGPGTGLVGDVPTSGTYVGRLPQLKAPYRLCGLSCHAITSGLQKREGNQWRILGGADDWQVRDQPSEGSYQHLDEYDFQVMVWEDDVWYMELVLYPPSTDDAYKVIANSICGPTSRWQMMRHWNVINPGDHDYGMDDVKGPEQIAIRRMKGLGQDPEYMKRNFQIVHHLITGEETVDPLANPKKWRAWKMPAGDFTFVILDSRLWRSSQDVDIWDDAGWGAFKSIYGRNDPTRSLLGEEQFGWLQQLLTTDTSPLICLTGINGLHTIWASSQQKQPGVPAFEERNRVAADYAGWVKAGSDRVIELLGARDGVVTVYGDVHNGCIMRNTEHGVIECSFGPIGRSGGRGVIPGFGRKMKDWDGRDLEVVSLYHKTHADPDLNPHPGGSPFYWNFLEMEFDPSQPDPAIDLRVRNLVDSRLEEPRGGGSLSTTASRTGRPLLSKLPPLTALDNADVRFTTLDGRPVRGTRTGADGKIHMNGFTDVAPGESVVMVSRSGNQATASVVETLPMD